MGSRSVRLRVLADALASLRIKNGDTQSALSERSRVSQGYLSELEGGSKEFLSPTIAKRLAEALGVQPSAFTVIERTTPNGAPK